MCGRYTLYDTDYLDERFAVDATEKLRPNYNVAPTQNMPVIRSTGGKRKLELMHWGIPRVLGKDLVKEIINTRADKAFGRFWRKQVAQQRILVPANGFYEWKRTNDGKTPYLISLPNDELYAFAGIWNSWTDVDGHSFDAYSIMTTEPNAEMRDVHDRMPVILHRQDEADWLSPDTSEERISEMLLTPTDGFLKVVQVSRDVNNVRNNDTHLLEPVAS